jgi:hypothetical protein
MIYLDTSAAVPMFVPEPASPAIEAWFESCTEPLVSSDWIVTEFSSALSIKVRKGEISAKQAQAAWKDFDAFCKSGLRLLPVSRKRLQRLPGWRGMRQAACAPVMPCTWRWRLKQAPAGLQRQTRRWRRTRKRAAWR